MPAHRVEHRRGGELVEPEVELGVGGAGRDVRVGGEMEHAVELRLGEQGAKPVAREHVLLEEMEGVRRLEMRDVAAAAEMQVVDAPHLVAAPDQAVAQMAADEAGAAGHERAHGLDAIIADPARAVRTGSRAPRGRS